MHGLGLLQAKVCEVDGIRAAQKDCQDVKERSVRQAQDRAECGFVDLRGRQSGQAVRQQIEVGLIPFMRRPIRVFVFFQLRPVRNACPG